MLTVEQALTAIRTHVVPAAPVNLDLEQAAGCVLAEDVISRTDSPPFDKSAMDGYAIRSLDRSPLQIIGEVTAGQVSELQLEAGQAIRIMTGAPIPSGADAVVPFELTSDVSETVALNSKVTAGDNIIPRGKMMRSGDVVLRTGTLLRAPQIALLAELGQSVVSVRHPPRVAVLATGDELVPIDQEPGPGQIRNSNALMLATQVKQAGAEPVILGIAKDERDDLESKVARGLEADFLCLSGGVSAGKLDFVPSVLTSHGVEQVFHKVRMKPGKPIWFGKTTTGRYVFGLPGNPVSSMVCFELFVRAAMRAFCGLPALKATQATITTNFSYQTDRSTYFPASLTVDRGQFVVTPNEWKGSADLRSAAEANCSLLIPVDGCDYQSGDVVDVLPWGTLQ